MYDSNEYEVNVTVREEDLKAPDQNKIYYGHSPEGEIFVGEYPGERGYEVYCIDQSKALPPKEPESRTKYIVLNDPDSKELNHMTMNRYGDKLAENLKMLFYFQLFPTSIVRMTEERLSGWLPEHMEIMTHRKEV